MPIVDLSKYEPFDLEATLLCEPVVLARGKVIDDQRYMYTGHDPVYADLAGTQRWRHLVFRPLRSEAPSGLKTCMGSTKPWAVGDAIRVDTKGKFGDVGQLYMAPKKIKKQIWLVVYLSAAGLYTTGYYTESVYRSDRDFRLLHGSKVLHEKYLEYEVDQ